VARKRSRSGANPDRSQKIWPRKDQPAQSEDHVHPVVDGDSDLEHVVSPGAPTKISARLFMTLPLRNRRTSRPSLVLEGLRADDDSAWRLRASCQLKITCKYFTLKRKLILTRRQHRAGRLPLSPWFKCLILFNIILLPILMCQCSKSMAHRLHHIFFWASNSSNWVRYVNWNILRQNLKFHLVFHVV